MENKTTKKTSWWKWLLMLSLSIVLLYFAFRGVKWSDFIDGLRSCNFWWIAASMAASILAFWFRGLRWRLLMLPLNSKITRREAYDGVTVGYLINFALPRAGEFARCGVIASTKKTSFEKALGSVVLERTFDLLSYIIILTITIFGSWEVFGKFITNEFLIPLKDRIPFNLSWILAILSIIFAAFIYIFIHYKKQLSGNKVFAKFYNILSGLKDGLISGFKMKGIWKFLLLTFCVWACYWIMSMTTILAFPSISHLNGFDALFLMIIGGLGWIVPVQGGIGAYHFVISLAASSIYGIAQTDGVIFATISHESQAITMILCGAISLAIISLSKKRKKSEK